MKILSFFILSTTLLLADVPPLEDELNLSSKEAIYDGSSLKLNGEIKLMHGLGLLSSEKATLQKQENKTDIPFSHMTLQKDVFITLQNKATLSCQQAELNFLTLEGTLSSSENSKVSYKDLIKGSSAEPTPIEILSKTITLLLKKQNSATLNEEYALDQLSAKEDVTIKYNKDFVLTADEATYETSTPGNKVNGTLKAYQKTAETPCKIFSKEDSIQTPYIEIDLDKNLLFMENPKGQLASSTFSENENGKVLFSCQKLKWDHEKGLLHLQKDITIEEASFGSLIAEKEVIIEKNSSQIKSISVNGKSILTQKESMLTSFGQLHLDAEKSQITALSPKNKQLIYTDSQMQINANQALLEYTESSQELSSLTLKGNVKIETFDSGKKPKQGIADRLTYCPETKTLILLANPGKKVLFQDLEEEIFMSAQEVHLTQNPVTGKTDVKGVGNLKLFLSNDERDLLKNSLSQEISP